MADPSNHPTCQQADIHPLIFVYIVFNFTRSIADVALNSHAPKIAAALIICNGCLSFDLAFAEALWAFFVLHVTSPFGRWLLSHHLG